MKTSRTIRNCLPTFHFVCPKRWDDLAATDDPAARHCDQCDRQVYLCTTDEQTIAHAKAGHCIAREELVDSGPRLRLGKITPPKITELTEAQRRTLREFGINEAIRAAQSASRSCPECGYPVTDWRVTCRVCGFKLGRAGSGSTQS
jgi:hypothetical protein